MLLLSRIGPDPFRIIVLYFEKVMINIKVLHHSIIKVFPLQNRMVPHFSLHLVLLSEFAISQKLCDIKIMPFIVFLIEKGGLPN